MGDEPRSTSNGGDVGVETLAPPETNLTPPKEMEVRDALRTLEASEKPQSNQEKSDGFLNRTLDWIVKVFQEGRIAEMALVIGGSILAGLAVKKTVEKVFDISDWTKKKLDDVAGNTMKNILALAVGTSVAGGLYEALVNAKVPAAEILEIWNKRGVEGISALILEKVKNGTLHFSKDTWDSLATKLGLPAYESLNILETVSVEISDIYQNLETQLHLKEISDGLVAFVNEKCPVAIPTAQSWIQMLKPASIVEFAKKEGISLQDIIPRWLPDILKGGGAYLLLAKLFSGVGINKQYALPALVYFFLVKNGKLSVLGEGFMTLAKAMDHYKGLVGKKIDEILGCEAGLTEQLFKSIDVSELTEEILLNVQKHPVLATAAISGAWWMRSVIWELMIKMGHLPFKAAGFAMRNPLAAAYFAGLGRLAWIRRKEIVDEVLSLSDEKEDAQKSYFQKELYALLGIGEDHKISHLNQREQEIYEELLLDPTKAVKNFGKAVYEVLWKGNLSFAADAAGNVLLVGKDLNPVAFFSKMAWNELVRIWESVFGESDESVVMPIGGLMLMGPAAVGGLKAYSQLWKETKGAPWLRTRKLFKSCVPGTKEWRYLLWSSIEMNPVSYTVIHVYQHLEVNRLRKGLAELEAAIAAQNSSMIHEICEKLLKFGPFEEQKLVLKHMTKNRQMWEFNVKLDDIITDINAIQSRGTLVANLDTRTQMLQQLQNAKSHVEKTRGFATRFLRYADSLLNKPVSEVLKIFPDAKFDAFDEFFEKHRLQSAKSSFLSEIDELFKGKSSAQLQQEIDDILAKYPDGKFPVEEQKKLKMLANYLNAEKTTGLLKDKSQKIFQEMESLNPATRAQRLVELADDIELAEKSLKSRLFFEIETLQSQGTAKDSLEMKKLLNQWDERLIAFSQEKAARLNFITNQYRLLPRGIRPAILNEYFKRFGEKSVLTKIVVDGAKQRGKMMCLMASMMFAQEVFISEKSAEKKLIEMLEDMGPHMAQLLLDCLPLAGTFSNFYSAFSGKELLTTSDVSSAWDRTSNVIWGTVGLAGDIVTVIGAIPSGGGSILANILIRLAKLAKGGNVLAKSLIQKMPKIMKLSDEMGGLRKTGELIFTYLQKGAGAAERLAQNKKFVSGLQKVEKVGTITGTVMMGGALVSMGYGFVADVPPHLPEE